MISMMNLGTPVSEKEITAAWSRDKPKIWTFLPFLATKEDLMSEGRVNVEEDRCS